MTSERQAAASEMVSAVRLLSKQNHLPDAARVAGEAEALDLPLPLTARERLRLASVAEGAGQFDTAIALLQRLIRETPDAPEDEMARLKLGQLLRERDPAQSKMVLAAFLSKYPDSAWAGRARELQFP